jgi:AraC-like DNA-binding protein
VPLAEIRPIVELALDLTGDPAFGLHWAESLTPSSFAPISYLIAQSTNLSQGFASLAQFGKLLSDEPGYELLERDGQLTVKRLSAAGESLRMQRFTAEMVVASFFKLVRRFNVGARPERVSFAYAAPDYRDEYTRIFDQEVHFEQAYTGIVFDRALLDAASLQRDEGIHDALRALAERRMSRLTQDAPYALRVRDILVEGCWPRRIDMKSAARMLGVSARSLRRRLASEGKSYKAIEKDALASVAKRLLHEEQRTIQDTASAMGFANTTTFHRAFKCWTGTTPRAYREGGVSR